MEVRTELLILGFAGSLGRFFLDKAYSVEARDLTDKILQTLQAEFGAKLATRDWLSDDVKKASRKKVDTSRRSLPARLGTSKMGY